MQHMCEGCAVNMYCRWAVCAITAQLCNGNKEVSPIKNWLNGSFLTALQNLSFFQFLWSTLSYL